MVLKSEIMDKHLLPTVINDELISYFNKVENSILHVDKDAKIKYSLLNNILTTHVYPSDVLHKDKLVKNILGLHRLCKIPISFSKSLAISKTISYTIEVNNQNTK